jgi:hypothetical protein
MFLIVIDISPKVNVELRLLSHSNYGSQKWDRSFECRRLFRILGEGQQASQEDIGSGNG